jgi:hypothetical protein
MESRSDLPHQRLPQLGGEEGPAPPKQRRPRYTRPSVIDSAAQREAAGVVRAREIHIAGDKAP